MQPSLQIFAIIIGIIAILFMFGIKLLAVSHDKKNADEIKNKYDTERAKYQVGQTFTFKEDFYGWDIIIRKGRIGVISTLEPDYKIAVVAVSNLEIMIDLRLLSNFV